MKPIIFRFTPMRALPFILFTLIVLPAFGQYDSTSIAKEIMSSVGRPEILDSLDEVYRKGVFRKESTSDSYYYHMSKSRFLTGQLDAAFELATNGVEFCRKTGNKKSKAKKR